MISYELSLGLVCHSDFPDLRNAEPAGDCTIPNRERLADLTDMAKRHLAVWNQFSAFAELHFQRTSPGQAPALGSAVCLLRRVHGLDVRRDQPLTL